MVTKNPKISVYVPYDLKVRLLEKKEELHSNSLSSVVVSILEEYFGVAPAYSNAPSNAAWIEQVNTRLEILESKTTHLSKLLELKKKSDIPHNSKISQQISLPIEKETKSRSVQNDANENQDDNTLIMSTSQVTELTRISRKRLEKAKKNNKFPLIHEEWQVLNFEGKKLIDSRYTNTWKVTQI